MSNNLLVNILLNTITRRILVELCEYVVENSFGMCLCKCTDIPANAGVCERESERNKKIVDVYLGDQRGTLFANRENHSTNTRFFFLSNLWRLIRSECTNSF